MPKEFYKQILLSKSFIKQPSRFSELSSTKFQAPKGSSITTKTDAFEHLNIPNCTFEIQLNFQNKHRNKNLKQFLGWLY